MDKSTLRVTYLAKGVAWLEFTRPNQMNTFSPDQYYELAETLNQLNEDTSCTVCVITAYGKLFTAGTDIFNIVQGIRGTKTQPPLQFKNDEDELQHWIKLLQSQAGAVVRAMINFEKILIYAPQAGCVGFGTTVSQLCDYVVCAESAWFTTPFMGLNFCAEGCSSYTFPKILGPHLAKEMLLGQKKLTSAEALKSGFVNYVYPDESFKRDTLQFAAKMAVFDQDTLKLTKRLITKHEKSILLETNDIELEELARCFAGAKAKKSLFAFVDRQIAAKKKQAELKRRQEEERIAAFSIDRPKSIVDKTQRIDKMINSLGGWDKKPPTPGSLIDQTVQLSAIPTGGEKRLLDSSLPESQKIVIKGQHLQQNVTRTVDIDDDDIPIDTNTRVQPPQPKRPFEPIPPLLV